MASCTYKVKSLFSNDYGILINQLYENKLANRIFSWAVWRRVQHGSEFVSSRRWSSYVGRLPTPPTSWDVTIREADLTGSPWGSKIKQPWPGSLKPSPTLQKFIPLNYKLSRPCFVIMMYFLGYKKQLSESQILEGRPQRRLTSWLSCDLHRFPL